MRWDAIDTLGPAPAPTSHDEYRARQQRLLNQLPHDTLLILPTNPMRTRTADVEFPFRADSDVIYLTGFAEPGTVLVADHADSAWRVTLYVQPRDLEREVWNGRRPGVEGALADHPIDHAVSLDDLESDLAGRLAHVRSVHHVTGRHAVVDGLVDAALNRLDRARMRQGDGPTARIDPRPLLGELRLRKSPTEIAHMRHASRISSLAHVEAMRQSRPGVSEYHLQAVLEAHFRFLGGSGWAYPSIVGGGDNATILHYTDNDDTIAEDDVVLIDAAAEFRGYASDITRSWPVSGRFTPAQRAIYEVVLASQLAAIDATRPGVPFDAPHKAARRVLAEGLIDLGILSGEVDEVLENGAMSRFYMHNTSHWIGLDVHDVGPSHPGGEPRLLEPGMVLTIEPGLYFGAWREDMGDVDPAYLGIGCRIEDDVLVTETGHDVLTSDCPKDPDELEAIIGSAHA